MRLRRSPTSSKVTSQRLKYSLCGAALCRISAMVGRGCPRPWSAPPCSAEAPHEGAAGARSAGSAPGPALAAAVATAVAVAVKAASDGAMGARETVPVGGSGISGRAAAAAPFQERENAQKIERERERYFERADMEFSTGQRWGFHVGVGGCTATRNRQHEIGTAPQLTARQLTAPCMTHRSGRCSRLGSHLGSRHLSSSSARGPGA